MEALPSNSAESINAKEKGLKYTAQLNTSAIVSNNCLETQELNNEKRLLQLKAQMHSDTPPLSVSNLKKAYTDGTRSSAVEQPTYAHLIAKPGSKMDHHGPFKGGTISPIQIHSAEVHNS